MPSIYNRKILDLKNVQTKQVLLIVVSLYTVLDNHARLFSHKLIYKSGLLTSWIHDVLCRSRSLLPWNCRFCLEEAKNDDLLA
jgi:hypothetical protein